MPHGSHKVNIYNEKLRYKWDIKHMSGIIHVTTKEDFEGKK